MNWLDANYLPWLIPIPPLVAFFAIILVAGRSKPLSHVIAIGAIALSWLMSFAEVLSATRFRDLGTPARGVFASGVNWLANGSGGVGSGTLTMGVLIDPLTTILLFMVPLACLLIFIYSLGYMADDPRNTRFFAYLSLFASAMLTLVVADNLLLLFIGWEVMGLCSYLLIGFWYEKESAYRAAIKAFMTTRVADVIFMIGIVYLWATTGTLNFRAIMSDPNVLHMLGTTPAVGSFLGLTAAGLIGILIVVGTIGKSAQFPLHVWLPDAMEGPTPVSAMIHAATMVSAGVYLVIRMYPVLSAGGNPEAGVFTAPMILMAVVGAFTALFAATIAITQFDIKRVLAYSTISQLGFMIAALGVGAYAAAAFHLITHAFFKALLFLGSGSVIHGMEHGEHLAHDAHGHDAQAAEDTKHAEHGVQPSSAPFDPQDMRNMGGLWRKMPVTTATFTIGALSLAGFPIFFAGFWSKDEIFAEAWHAASTNILGVVVLLVLALAAILTAAYSIRQLAFVFMGEPRTEAARYALHNDGTTAGRNISAQLTAPLIVLAFFAIFAGFVGVNPGFTGLGPALSGIGINAPFAHFVGRTLLEPTPILGFNIIPVIISFGVFFVGGYLGIAAYISRPYNADATDPVQEYAGRDVYRLLQNRYFIDQIYQRFLVRPSVWLSEVFVPVMVDHLLLDRILNAIVALGIFLGNIFRAFNSVVIDGVGDGIPEALGDAARAGKSIQSGNIQRYLLYALSAAVVVGLNLALLVIASRELSNFILLIEIVAVGLLVYFNVSRPASTTSGGD